jgi:hypothetical protein
MLAAAETCADSLVTDEGAGTDSNAVALTPDPAPFFEPMTYRS